MNGKSIVTSLFWYLSGLLWARTSFLRAWAYFGFGPICFGPEPVYFGPGPVYFGLGPVYFGQPEPPIREPLAARTIGSGARSWPEPLVLETTAQNQLFWSQSAARTVASGARPWPERFILEVTGRQNHPFWSDVPQNSWSWRTPLTRTARFVSNRPPKPPVLEPLAARPPVLQRAPGC